MGEPVTVQDPETGEQVEVKIYQRIIGDAEIAAAKEAALRSSALKRTQLRSPTNLDRLLLIPEFDKLSTDDLVSLIILNELADIRAQASRELRFPYPEEPKGDASLEKQEKYQEEVDTYFERREEVLKDKIEELVRLRDTELKSMGRPALENLYEEVAINSACREEMLVIFNSMIAYLATFDDAEFTSRSFSSFSTFQNANTDIKRQLIEAYLQLEISGEKLKK